MKELPKISKLLVVVDMVNGFVREGVMHDRKIEMIIPGITALIEKQLAADEGVILVRDCHDEDCAEFRKFPPHCIKGTSESELVDEIRKYQDRCIVFEKNSTSTMMTPGFKECIDKMTELKEVVVVGCCSDICILNLAIPLTNYFDQVNRIVPISAPANLIETYDAPNHPAAEFDEMAITLMKQAGINTEEC